MQQNAGAAKRKDNTNDQNRNYVHNTVADRYTVYNHHHKGDAETDHHLKAIDHHIGNDQHELRQINFRYDRFITSDHTDGTLHTTVEEIPERQTNKDINIEILQLLFKQHAEYKSIDQHETKWLQYPPQPVQVGIGHLCL